MSNTNGYVTKLAGGASVALAGRFSGRVISVLGEYHRRAHLRTGLFVCILLVGLYSAWWINVPFRVRYGRHSIWRQVLASTAIVQGVDSKDPCGVLRFSGPYRLIILRGLLPGLQPKFS